MISDQLHAAVRTSRIRGYQLAALIGVHPTTLSAWLNRIYKVRRDDPRVIRLGALVGVPADRCFAEAEPDPTVAARDEHVADGR